IDYQPVLHPSMTPPLTGSNRAAAEQADASVYQRSGTVRNAALPGTALVANLCELAELIGQRLFIMRQEPVPEQQIDLADAALS
ncbi:hypothetical protein ACC793_37230, partial [Rhizobium ruizarguesonis]